ncbi:MAG TPA: cell division protein FtsZ [Chitinophagaceae bacterium]|nr:cell division protein FtsZ [Chitinophagaceae bacterium]
MIHFDLPKEKSSIIKVIGVGGGGSNAVNYMFSQSIDGVNFIICNTDAQAISQSQVPNKIQLGPHLTQGLGAGANPAIGREATEESLEEIKRILEVNTKMAFITAGMGGGTGTGGAPIIAKICQDLGILTVGIVTTPFAYEGKKRIAQAEEGIRKLKDYVDTLLVISNDKLRHQFGNLTMKAAFCKADNVLATAAKCITDVINSTGQINVDFADVCTVMRNGGVAILGSAACEGENRAQQAIEDALNSPLLNDNDIRGAKWILININSAEGDTEFTMDEVETIQNHLLSQAGENTDVILGLGYDNNLGEKIGITLIATGFEHKDPFDKKETPKEEIKIEEKIVMTLGQPEEKKPAYQQPVFQFDEKPKEEEKPLPQVDLKQEVKTQPKKEPVAEPVKEDLMAPTITEVPAPSSLGEREGVREDNRKTTVDKSEPEIIHFELTSTPDPIPAETPAPITAEIPKQETKKSTTNNDAVQVTAPTSGGYLAKPSNLYVEEPQQQQESKKTIEEPLPLQMSAQVDEPAIEMQLVVKDSLEATEEPEQNVQQAQPIMMSNVEEQAMPDETDELKRKAMERIAKLRNLSFNINAADPNNEFESVPAYLRRNMELHNSIADVESFYSNYTVKSDQNNQAQISTINTFLEGKKPD